MGTPKNNPRGYCYKESGDYDSRNDLVRIWGRWTDTGVPGLGTVQGKGFTVTRDGVGIWTVTFDQGFIGLQSASACTYCEASGAGVDQVGEVSTFTPGVAGACTLRVLNFTGAAAADLAAGDYMCFEAVLFSQWLD